MCSVAMWLMYSQCSVASQHVSLQQRLTRFRITKCCVFTQLTTDLKVTVAFQSSCSALCQELVHMNFPLWAWMWYILEMSCLWETCRHSVWCLIILLATVWVQQVPGDEWSHRLITCIQRRSCFLQDPGSFIYIIYRLPDFTQPQKGSGHPHAH